MGKHSNVQSLIIQFKTGKFKTILLLAKQCNNRFIFLGTNQACSLMFTFSIS